MSTLFLLNFYVTNLTERGKKLVSYETYNIYTGLLKTHDIFRPTSAGVNLTYDVSDEKLRRLREKYTLDGVAGGGDDLSKALRLLHWLSDSVYHKGDGPSPEPMNSLSLLEYAYKKGSDCGINCRALSIILTECLLSIGIPARTVYIMPCSPYDFDNHVISHAFIKPLNKWVMLDPTFSSYVLDENNNILNCVEIRSRLANRENISFNKEIHYNGEKRGRDSGEYTEYLAKDLFYFSTYERSGYGAEQNSRRITICPKNFDAKVSAIYNVEYRIKLGNNNEQMRDWLKSVKKEKLIYASTDELLKSP